MVFVDRHQAIGIAIGQRAEKSCVHHRVDRGVGADAQGQRDHGGGGEAGGPSQGPRRQAKIAAQVVEQAQVARFTALFLVRLDRPELQSGLSLGFRSRQAAPGQIVGADLDVGAKLLFHVPLEPRAADESVEPRAQARPHGHASSALARNAAAIADTRRFQPSVSSWRRFRPAPVRV